MGGHAARPDVKGKPPKCVEREEFMAYQPDQRPWAVQPHHFDDVDVVLASPAGLNHLGFDNAGGRWFLLQQFGSSLPISAGDAIMLRPADIDLIIKQSWGWAQSRAGHPRCLQLSDEISAGAKTILLHFASADR